MGYPERNSPCPCGSGKKYKKCCLVEDEKIALQKLSGANVASYDEPIPDDHLLEDLKPGSDFEQVSEPENENVTRLWDMIDSLKYPDDTFKCLSIIETFIKTFPDLVVESCVIDEMFYLEENLFRKKSHNMYCSLLENVEKYAPQFYNDEFEYFDLPRVRNAIANKQIDKVELLLERFKKDPVTTVDSLSTMVDLLAWAGLDKELLELAKVTYKPLENSDDVLDSSFVSNWIYFDIFITTVGTSLPIDDCISRIEQQVSELLHLPLAEQASSREFYKNAIIMLREDHFEWDCPFGKDMELLEFFINMGWQFMKYIKKTTGCTYFQAEFIVNQLHDYWNRYKTMKYPKRSIYFITNEKIEQFTSSLESINAVGFLQSIWHFADYLHVHNRIDLQTKQNLQAYSSKLYTTEIARSLDWYPSGVLISEFPYMQSIVR
ncbi:MAG: SEC-C metal-binding domain-containing protein [Fibrobacterota bacterium]|nr:SEC-C metal-binding domain-containing protein [Chitinispirillaceae bacterium]